MPSEVKRIAIREDKLCSSSKLAADRVNGRVDKVIEILDHIARVRAQYARLANIPTNTLRREIRKTSSDHGDTMEECVITIDIERPPSPSFLFGHNFATEQDLVHKYGLTEQHVHHMEREIDHLVVGTSRWLAYFRARGCRTMSTEKMLATLREELRALKTYHATLLMVQYRVHGRIDIVAQESALHRARGRMGNDLRIMLEEAAELTMPDCHPTLASSSEESLVGVSGMASRSEESLVSTARTASSSGESVPSLAGASSISAASFISTAARMKDDTFLGMRQNGDVRLHGNKRIKIAPRC